MPYGCDVHALGAEFGLSNRLAGAGVDPSAQEHCHAGAAYAGGLDFRRIAKLYAAKLAFVI
jgi:hypothetical protein